MNIIIIIIVVKVEQLIIFSTILGNIGSLHVTSFASKLSAPSGIQIKLRLVSDFLQKEEEGALETRKQLLIDLILRLYMFFLSLGIITENS